MASWWDERVGFCYVLLKLGGEKGPPFHVMPGYWKLPCEAASACCKHSREDRFDVAACFSCVSYPMLCCFCARVPTSSDYAAEKARACGNLCRTKMHPRVLSELAQHEAQRVS